MPLFVILALAAGTYAFRVCGPVLRHRLRIPDRMERWLSDAAAVLLTALAATSALTQGHRLQRLGQVGRRRRWRGPGRQARAVPVVVVAAAGTTALLRLVGLS